MADPSTEALIERIARPAPRRLAWVMFLGACAAVVVVVLLVLSIYNVRAVAQSNANLLAARHERQVDINNAVHTALCQIVNAIELTVPLPAAVKETCP